MDNGKFESDILDSAAIVRQGCGYLITNGGKIIAALTLVVAVLVMFTDVTLAASGSYSFAIMLIMMLLASYIMFFSLENAGERLGEDTEEYRTALKRYALAKGKINSSDIAPLRAFCTEYSRQELEYRRLSVLTEHGYTKEEYEQYLNKGSSFDRRARRVLRRCAKMRTVALTPQILLSDSARFTRSELTNPDKYKLLYLALQLIPSTLCMAFTVSIMLSTKDGLGMSGVIDGIFKLTALPIIGFRGYSEGYSYVKNYASSWLETRARLLETFLAQNPR